MAVSAVLAVSRFHGFTVSAVLDKSLTIEINLVAAVTAVTGVS